MADSVGFVGLGIMGRPMAVNLGKSCAVIGFDLDDSRAAGLPNIARAGSMADLAGRCSIVCLSLPSAQIVEGVTIGAGGLAESLKAGSVVIDFSTNIPSVSRRIAARLADKGIEFADAPVSGGEPAARAGSLAIMVGAAQRTFERCFPYLSAVGTSVVRVGEVGAGAVAKLVNNMIVGAAFAVIAEGFALAEANGVDARLLHEAIRDGWAGSKVLEVSAKSIVEHDYTPGGTINMLEKDLGYARLLATESRIPVPMTAMAHEVLVAGQAAGHGGSSQPAIIEMWRAAKELPSRFGRADL
ncbi:MAG TPA: NAD(P)-binding domain-containing protein [Spirochaetia bacterium]|nr:NAD(P)-binding domain-containing protein [Spirochaetia bacterium]